MINTIYKNRHS